MSKTEARFQIQRDYLINSVSKIQEAMDDMHKEVTTTLTGRIELVTCRLENLDLKLKEQHMVMLEKLKASKSAIAENIDLKATCKGCEDHNTRLHRKLTEAKCKEVCFIC